MSDASLPEPEIAPSMDAVLSDPTASFALKATLRLWSDRDPVDAARDAAILCRVLETRADRRLATAALAGVS